MEFWRIFEIMKTIAHYVQIVFEFAMKVYAYLPQVLEFLNSIRPKLEQAHEYIQAHPEMSNDDLANALAGLFPIPGLWNPLDVIVWRALIEILDRSALLRDHLDLKE